MFAGLIEFWGCFQISPNVDCGMGNLGHEQLRIWAGVRSLTKANVWTLPMLFGAHHIN